jgi:hypothetical protein
MVKAVGPAFGFGAYAQSIVQGADGRYQLPDPAARAAIFGNAQGPRGERHDGWGFYAQQCSAAGRG